MADIHGTRNAANGKTKNAFQKVWTVKIETLYSNVKWFHKYNWLNVKSWKWFNLWFWYSAGNWTELPDDLFAFDDTPGFGDTEIDDNKVYIL